MLPRLQAEERLAAIDVALLAAGGFEQHDARAMMEGLRIRAQGGEQSPAKKASPAQLGMLGIGVTIVPPEEPAHG